MRHIFKLSSILLTLALITSCSLINNNTNTSHSLSSSSSQEETSEEITSSNTTITEDIGTGDGVLENGLAKNPQDGVILHAWSWGLDEIKKAIPDIAKAGYSAVQTSPIQPQKDYYQNDHINSWWKLYQPLGFEVATKNNAIGTKKDLIALCQEADKYGVKVIVDVVANHLAGGSVSKFHRDVEKYEPEIYRNDLKHSGLEENSDKDGRLVVQGTIGGFPDLKTEDARVQNAVLDLLKEYVDCGVDGFRFDAAKHIELPEDDPNYASEFWNVTLNGVKEYAVSKNLPEPYVYGEILHTVGNSRSYANYTKRMSVTDSDASDATLKAVINKDSEEILTRNIYKEGVSSNTAVLWGESHDTFANSNGASRNVDSKTVNKAYAINASRNNAASLYFPRPDNSMKLGEITKNNDWKSNVISQVNDFHNHFIGSKENIISESFSYFMNFKQKDDDFGVLIVNLGNDKNFEFDALGNLGEGKYIDKVTGKEIIVKDGTFSGTFDDSGIMVLINKEKVSDPILSNKPFIKIKDNNKEIQNAPFNVDIEVRNADRSFYQIDNKEPVTFKDKTKVNIGEKDFEGEIKLKVTAIKGDISVAKEKTYTFMNGDLLHPSCINIDKNLLNGTKIAAWVWNDHDASNTSRWVNCVLDGTSCTFEVSQSDTHFVLATFKKDSQLDWSKKIKQTVNIKLGKLVYDLSSLTWK